MKGMKSLDESKILSAYDDRFLTLMYIYKPKQSYGSMFGLRYHLTSNHIMKQKTSENR